MDNKTSVCSKIKPVLLIARSLSLSGSCFECMLQRRVCVCVRAIFAWVAYTSVCVYIRWFSLCACWFCSANWLGWLMHTQLSAYTLQAQKERARSMIDCPHIHTQTHACAHPFARLSSQRSSACALCLSMPAHAFFSCVISFSTFVLTFLPVGFGSHFFPNFFRVSCAVFLVVLKSFVPLSLSSRKTHDIVLGFFWFFIDSKNYT